MKRIIVGISGINATENPGPGTGIARSLKEALPKIKTIGLSYDPHDPGHYMEFLFDNSFILPYPSKGWEAVGKGLGQLKKHFGLNVLIPCLDAELPLFIKKQKELTRMGIRHFLPSVRQFDYRAKCNLPHMGRQIGIDHPVTFAVQGLDEMVKVIKRNFEFPLMVKGNYYKAYPVFNMESAIEKFIEISSDWGYPILLQKIVSGAEINFCGVGDGLGNLVSHVSVKKQLTTSLGKIWTGVTIKEERLEKVARQFVKKTKWRGPFELECILAKDDLYLIEINPRFPAWVYFATAVGVNLPKILLDLIIKGKSKGPTDYVPGKFLVRYTYEMVTDLENFNRVLSQQRF